MVQASWLRSSERQRLGIAGCEPDDAIEPAFPRPFLPDGKHVGADVADRYAGVGPARLGDAEGDVAGAAGDIDDSIAAAAGRIEHRHHRVLPEAMEPAGHEIVHQVVAARDPLEDLVDHALLVGEIDGPKAEMGFAGARHCKPSVPARP